MPKGISRELFGKLSKFYNADVFRDAGIRIRQLAKEADSMKVEERIARIAQIFKWFKNPDRETVLTPWEVVNRHMSNKSLLVLALRGRVLCGFRARSRASPRPRTHATQCRAMQWPL
jgi:hypothetical protein